MACDAAHRFSKQPAETIRLIAGIGVAGDAHAGTTVQHRSRVAVDPTRPNLRQVHFLHAELLDDLAAAGFAGYPGDLGENVTARGIDLLALPRGTRLAIRDVVLEVTGLRNPCVQIGRFRPGLLKQVLGRAADGSPIRKAGVMAIVATSGEISRGDAIGVELPPPPHCRLAPV